MLLFFSLVFALALCVALSSLSCRRSYYYFAIVEDLFLRIAWLYILLMNEAGLADYNEGVISVFACLEVIRR